MKRLKYFWMMNSQFLNKRFIATSVFFAIFIWGVYAGITGLIGNYFYNFFEKHFLPIASEGIEMNLFLFIIVLIMFFILGYFLKDKMSNIFRNYGIGNHPEKSVQIINKINKSLQFSIEDLGKNPDLDKLFNKFFMTIFDFLGPLHMFGGGIILRSPMNPTEYLKFWKAAPDENASKKEFYIGNETNTPDEKYIRGMAGEVFISGKSEIVNILNPITGESDNPKFNHYNLEKLGDPRPRYPYGSGINLPIKYRNITIGVVSLESRKIYTFSEDSKEWLQPIADFLGTILALFKVDDNLEIKFE